MILAAGALLLCTTSTFDVVEVPAGTRLSVRITTAIPRHAQPGLALSAVLIAPVVRDDQVLLSAGDTLHATVADAGNLPHAHRRSFLRLEFGDIVAAGRARPIKARVADVDNARETVDAEGRIIGLARLPARPTKIEALLLLAAHAHPVALAALEAGKLIVRRAARAPIEYAPGTDMTLSLIEPLWLGSPPAEPGRSDLSTNPELVGLAADLPRRTAAGRYKRLADPTNILFVGTREELTDAFVAAGWTKARPLGLGAGAKAFFALAERHGYKPAPVSRLELEGAAPAVVFEKQNNTLTKRHHVRIWSRGESFDGRPVWLGAATHDVGIMFDHSSGTFTHRIDGRIDGEREKLMTDFEFTGRVRASGLVDRPAPPHRAESATRDRIETDGRLGVLVLAEGPPPRP